LLDPYLRAQQDALAGVSAELSMLREQLLVRPYMGDADTFATTDPEGRSTLGFDTPDPAPAGYRSFEDVFRGPEDRLRERQERYVDLLAEHPDIVDLGCGRGELLELLRARDIACRGVDIDPDMVERCREKGLDVVQSDISSWLAKQRDESIGAVVAAQVVEHLTYEELTELLRLIRAKLTKGGIAVLETVNPHALAPFKMFWLDLTHKVPIFPEVLVTLTRIEGFAAAYVLFPHGTGDYEHDRVTALEYAVVATSRQRSALAKGEVKAS
jgi:O-antigen chain-terminating methyltransferase